MKNPLFQKCALLALIGALLLIPLSMIERTIEERTARRAEAIRSIAASSAGEQSIAGPVLTIPVVEEYDDEQVEEITGGTDFITLGKQRVASRGYCARFNFKGPDQQKIVGNCSGGERNRIHLAKLLRSGGNLLLLDEPTNDLDVDTLRALEESLLGSRAFCMP